MCMYMFTYWNMEIYKCEYVQNNQLIHKHIHLTIYQSRHWRIGRYVDIIHVRLYFWNMYLNICTYMSQQMQLMYTERPCFGENKRTQKITQNTRKYILRRATKVTISKKKPCFVRFFLAGVTEQNDAHLQSFFARNAACRARKDGVSGHERARASLIRGQHQGFGFGKGGRVGVVGSCEASRDGVSGH